MSNPIQVLIIGDSISIGYTPCVIRLLAGKAEVIHNPGNGEDSANLRAHLVEWLGQTTWDVIHFNCGLHDLKRHPPDSRLQVPLDAYEANLRWVGMELRKRTKARLIWPSTTPVIEDLHQKAKGGAFARYQRDVLAYNAVASRVMTELRVPINDLHSVAQQAGPASILGEDGVHFTEAGSERLGQAVAEAITAQAS